MCRSVCGVCGKPPMIVFRPPHQYTLPKNLSIFLAGSIEMGRCVDWQTVIESECDQYDVTILNPRRPDWDSSWEQSINNENFVQQVEWELDSLAAADFIFLYFDPNTAAPISLLELGIFSNKDMVVCCPDGFYRKGNVEIFCKRESIPLMHTLNDATDYLRNKIQDTL